ncbi:MAG: hypothetical protein AAGI23_09620 [Bacteroidota bacterium]
MRNYFLLLLLLCTNIAVFAQDIHGTVSGGVSFSTGASTEFGVTNGFANDPSAVIQFDYDISDVPRGMLIPRMSTAERVSISSPANGLIVYDTNTNFFYYWNASIPDWVNLLNSDSSSGANLWSLTGSTIRPTNLTQNVGVNTSSANARLSINGSGAINYGIYALSNDASSGNTGVFGESAGTALGTGQAYGVRGLVSNVGTGSTYGVRGDATRSSPIGSGRTYGVYGQAGNATPNFNYGVFGALTGANNGAAVVGHDRIGNPSWGGSTNGRWAGYFVGNTHISEKLTIGTTNMPTTLGSYDLTGYKLYVCGGILSDEWLVPNVNWCDYVFEDEYELTSLPEVENHIQENGHLHNTPSAEEVENNGLEVASMTINQQEKIEELFLHMIEMDKRVRALEERNEVLRAENTALKVKLNDSNH